MERLAHDRSACGTTAWPGLHVVRRKVRPGDYHFHSPKETRRHDDLSERYLADFEPD